MLGHGPRLQESRQPQQPGELLPSELADPQKMTPAQAADSNGGWRKAYIFLYIYAYGA